MRKTFTGQSSNAIGRKINEITESAFGWNVHLHHQNTAFYTSSSGTLGSALTTTKTLVQPENNIIKRFKKKNKRIFNCRDSHTTHHVSAVSPGLLQPSRTSRTNQIQHWSFSWLFVLDRVGWVLKLRLRRSARTDESVRTRPSWTRNSPDIPRLPVALQALELLEGSSWHNEMKMVSHNDWEMLEFCFQLQLFSQNQQPWERRGYTTFALH